MKRIDLGNGRVIETPWMNAGEIALYLTQSRTEAGAILDGIPCRGTGRNRRYHCLQVDEYLMARKDNQKDQVGTGGEERHAESKGRGRQ